MHQRHFEPVEQNQIQGKIEEIETLHFVVVLKIQYVLHFPLNFKYNDKSSLTNNLSTKRDHLKWTINLLNVFKKSFESLLTPVKNSFSGSGASCRSYILTLTPVQHIPGGSCPYLLRHSMYKVLSFHQSEMRNQSLDHNS